MSDRDVRKLAKIVADHSRQIKGLSGGPQAAYSSIEGGSMDSYDSDGKLRLRIGAQDDGTQGVKYVQGPPPPRPTAPVVSVDGPVVRVRWDGMLVGGHIPEDFSRIDVHFALASDDLEDPAAVRGNLATSAGNETVLAATSTGTYRVGLVAMSQSRARSEMSDTVEVEVELVNLKGAIDTAVDNSRGGSNHYSPEPPPGTDHDPERDLWFDTSVDDDGLTHYTPHRWDPETQQWVSLEDERVQAIQDAQEQFGQDISDAEQRALDEARRLAGMGARAGANLVKNGSFEYGDVGWERFEGTIRKDASAHEGDHVLRLDASTVNQFPLAGPVEARPGAVFHVEYWVRRVAGGTDPSLLRFYSVQERSDGSTVSVLAVTESGSTTLAHGGDLEDGVWTRIEGTLVVDDPDVVSVEMGPHISISGTAYDIDSVSAVDVSQERDAVEEAKADAQEKADAARDQAVQDAEAKDQQVRSDIDGVIDQARSDLESEIDTVRTSVDGKNRITQSTSAPPAQYDGAVGDRWERMSSMGSGGRLISNWRWNGDVWVSTLLSDAVIASLDASKIHAGYLDSARIKAGTITADKMVVGVSQNLVVDSKFKNPTITAARSTSTWAPVESGHETWMGNGGSKSIRSQVLYLTTSGGANPPEARLMIDKSTRWAIDVEVFVGDGAEAIERFFFSAAAYLPDGTPRYLTSQMLKEDGTGVVTTADGWTRLTTTMDWSVYAEDYVSVAPRMFPTAGGGGGGWYYLRNPYMAEQVGTTIITDGAVTTGKVAANAIDAGKIAAGAVEAEHIVAGGIEADSLIVAGSLGETTIAEGAISTRTLAADAVTADKVAARAIGATAIAAGAIEAEHITAGKLLADAVLVGGSVGSTLIEDGAITTGKIAAGSITGESGILAHLDAGSITYGEMSGARIEAGTIDTEQLAFGAATGDILAVDALNFKTATGLDIRSSSFRAGDSVEITEDFGIRQFGPDGALNVSLPSDGSEAQFRGDLSARTLTATGRMSIQGPGAVASGGVLELESGVVPPVNPPGASSYVAHTTFPALADDESPWGLAWAGGSWWRAINVTGTAEGDRVERISPTGELLSSFPTEEGDPRGLTAIGDELFLLASRRLQGGENRTVFVYDLAGNLKREWDYPNYGTGTYQPGIGTDGTHILIAQCWASGALTWRRFNKTTGALMSQVDTTYYLRNDVTNIMLGTFDFGTQSAVITSGGSTGSVFLLEPNGVQAASSAGWWAAGKQQVRGTAWVDGRFHHLAPDGNLVTHSTVAYPNGGPSPDTNDWWVALTWSDGTRETTIGPTRQFMFRRRYDVRVSFGTPPGGVTQARVYLARKETEPGRADFHYVGQVDATAGQATIVLPPNLNDQPNPPASNSFPNSTPGVVRSTLGQFEVDGTGAGRWGPLTFHPDGSMSSDQVPEWIPVTTFRTGFGPQTWGFVPAYRIWPDGKVEWRGVIAGSVTTTVAAITVPVAARPPHPVNLLAATNAPGGADASTRIEFGQKDEPDIMRIYRGSADRTWVSLDAASYYLA